MGAANIVFVWIDFLANRMELKANQVLFVLAWACAYGVFHSVVYALSGFIAYPFLDPTKYICVAWILGILLVHGFLFFAAAVASRHFACQSRSSHADSDALDDVFLANEESYDRRY